MNQMLDNFLTSTELKKELSGHILKRASPR